MKKQQDQIALLFSNHGWEYWSQERMFRRLVEEVGELARAMAGEDGSKPPKPGEHCSTPEEEMGDILYTLACMANVRGLDLENLLQGSIEKVERRDKDRF